MIRSNHNPLLQHLFYNMETFSVTLYLFIRAYVMVHYFTTQGCDKAGKMAHTLLRTSLPTLLNTRISKACHTTAIQNQITFYKLCLVFNILHLLSCSISVSIKNITSCILTKVLINIYSLWWRRVYFLTKVTIPI